MDWSEVLCGDRKTPTRKPDYYDSDAHKGSNWFECWRSMTPVDVLSPQGVSSRSTAADEPAVYYDALRRTNDDPAANADDAEEGLVQSLNFHQSGFGAPLLPGTMGKGRSTTAVDAISELLRRTASEPSEYLSARSGFSTRSGVTMAKSFRRTSLKAAGDGFEGARQAFVGDWIHLNSEHYDDFLQDNLGLRWGLAVIGARIHPTPSFELLADGQTLRCTTICLGAKPVIEDLMAGQGEFHEPNLDVDYQVVSRWEHDESRGGVAVFVAERHGAKINNGRATVQRRWVETTAPYSGQLVIEQDWGGKHKFIARFAKDNKNGV